MRSFLKIWLAFLIFKSLLWHTRHCVTKNRMEIDILVTVATMEILHGNTVVAMAIMNSLADTWVPLVSQPQIYFGFFGSLGLYH